MRPAFRRYSAMCFIAAVLAAAPTAAGAARIGGVDGIMSTVMQQKQSSFSGLGLRLRLRSDQLIDNIEFLPSLEYWRNSSNVETFAIETMREDATIGMDVRYLFRNEGWEPYVGAGWALHFLSSRVEAPGLPNAEHSFAKGGLAALAGVSFPLTNTIQNFLELKYHHVTENRQLKINWGVSWILGG